MDMLLHVYFLLAITYFSPTEGARLLLSKVGPFNWLHRLGRDELAELHTRCVHSPGGPNSKGAITPSFPSQRILGGQEAPRNAFKYAASLAISGYEIWTGLPPNAKFNACGAILITRRHLLTAAHCFQIGDVIRGRHLRLLVGGPCIRPEGGQNCSQVDSIEVKYDFVIKQYFVLSAGDPDDR